MCNQSKLVKEFTLCDDDGKVYKINMYEVPVIFRGDTIGSKIAYNTRFKTSDGEDIFLDDDSGQYYFTNDTEKNHPLTKCT